MLRPRGTAIWFTRLSIGGVALLVLESGFPIPTGEGGPDLGLEGNVEGLGALGPPERINAHSKSRSSRRRRRTLELRAAVVLRIETIARSRRSSGRSPAQPASRARISSSVALFVGVSSDGRSGLRAARRRDRRNGFIPRRPSSTSQIASRPEAGRFGR